jgi:hypothetical protein
VGVNLWNWRRHGGYVGEAGLGPQEQVAQGAVQLEADRGDLWGVCTCIAHAVHMQCTGNAQEMGHGELGRGQGEGRVTV